MQAEARICTARRRDGQPCSAPALPSSSEHRCFAHDSARQDALKASRAAGGRGRSTVARATRYLPPHLAGVQQTLLDLIDAVQAGEVEPPAATAVATLTARLLDLAKFNLEVGEQRALEQRLAELETALAAAGWRGRA